ncbi:hypothetical protein A2897_03590 [Candidatus Woesebacteria bacterium RIFCSPLOWO2_01_FULL_44_24b]|nr:MAG: hypothetical protein A2897_03590 [Candidatus Woesebacteria bacterium RIFCSPLOWO2_01_FULL_44_24b]
MSREIELKDGQGIGYMRKDLSGDMKVVPAQLGISDGGPRIAVDFGGYGTVLNRNEPIQLALPVLEEHVIEAVNIERRRFYKKVYPESEPQEKAEALLNSVVRNAPNLPVSVIGIGISGILNRFRKKT